MSRQNVRYSEAFKLQVVSDMESGKFANQSEAQRAYGITGATTISSWLQKYGKEHLLPRTIRVETKDDRDQVEELKKKVRELEKALAKMTVKSVINEAYFEIACEQSGVADVEAMKKKVVALQSKRDS